jgi:hypothetical protein
LVKEGHWKVAKVEQSRVNVAALLELLENPLRWLFRKSTLAGSDDYRNYVHLDCSLRLFGVFD